MALRLTLLVCIYHSIWTTFRTWETGEENSRMLFLCIRWWGFSTSIHQYSNCNGLMRCVHKIVQQMIRKWIEWRKVYDLILLCASINLLAIYKCEIDIASSDYARSINQCILCTSIPMILLHFSFHFSFLSFLSRVDRLPCYKQIFNKFPMAVHTFCISSHKIQCAIFAFYLHFF